MGIMTYLLVNWLKDGGICSNVVDLIDKLNREDNSRDLYLQFEPTSMPQVRVVVVE